MSQYRASSSANSVFRMPNVSLGGLLALLVLLVAAVLWVVGHALSERELYAFICALALSRLLP